MKFEGFIESEVLSSWRLILIMSPNRGAAFGTFGRSINSQPFVLNVLLLIEA